MSENIKTISKLMGKGLGAKDSLSLVRALNLCNGKSYIDLNKNLTKRGFSTKIKNETKNARLQIYKNAKFIVSINM